MSIMEYIFLFIIFVVLMGLLFKIGYDLVEEEENKDFNEKYK